MSTILPGRRDRRGNRANAGGRSGAAKTLRIECTCVYAAPLHSCKYRCLQAPANQILSGDFVPGPLTDSLARRSPATPFVCRARLPGSIPVATSRLLDELTAELTVVIHDGSTSLAHDVEYVVQDDVRIEIHQDQVSVHDAVFEVQWKRWQDFQYVRGDR